MKKIWLSLFAMILALSMMTVSGKAADEIYDISLNGSSIKPADGKAEPDCVFKETGSKNYSIGSQNWTNAKTGSPIESFEKNMIAEYTLVLTAQNGYVFADHCTVEITGIAWNYCEAAPFEGGKYIKFTGTYTVPDPEKYWNISVKLSPEEGGTVNGNTKIQDGSYLELTAKPHAGWTFSHWMSEGYTLSYDNPFVFLPKSDMNLEAVFTKNSGGKVHIIAEKQPAEGGSLSVSQIDCDLNSAQTIEATAAYGYH
ncbi:MAG: hypothetical protein IIU06_05115, partial [Erysipelotrichales bacterium]|nr:hypothetical protein [Erysipelotrichales bacterium]